MSKNRVIYALLAAAAAVFSAAYKSRLSAVLLIAVICYPLLAALCVFIASRLIRAGFVAEGSTGGSSPRIVQQKGEEYSLWIYIKNGSVFPCVPLELLCNVPDKELGLFTHKRISASVPPLGGCRIAVPAMHRYRGAYIAQIISAAFFDPLRIIRITRKLSAEATLIFLPRRLDYGELIAEAPGEDSANPTPLKKGEREDFSHVREYIRGDMMQLVHWKLTAKLDELMIKQYDEAAERRALILCDYRTDGMDTGMAMKQADAVIEAAIAIASAAVKAGVDVRADFGAVSGEYRSDIGDEAAFERFYELSAIMPLRFATVGTERLLSEGIRAGASVVFVVTGHISEELFAELDCAAEGFSGIIVLADVNPSVPPELIEKAKLRRFEYFKALGKNQG